MSDLPITEVVNVSVSAAQSGVGSYNTSNTALFTREEYAGSFGSLGYKINLDPTQAEEDFGTDSVTAQMANAVFSQQPNILTGSGYLAIIPFLPAVIEVQHMAFSGTPVSGQFVANFNGHASAAILYNDNAAAIQTKLRAVLGLSGVVVAGSIPAGLDITFDGYDGDAPLITITGDTMVDGSSVAVTVLVTETTPGYFETIAQAIVRTQGLVQYFGVMEAEIASQADMLAAAAVIQPLNKIAFWVSRTVGDFAPGGMLDLLRTGNFHKNRGLFYGGAADVDALIMMASYVGRALSTDFTGSNTTQTMHLKDLIGVQPDPVIDTTYLNQCKTAGVDVYVSIQGVPKVFTSGANQFFDQVYNLGWLVGDLTVEGFNLLAETSTKIVQTEEGVGLLKGAYRLTCEQGVANQYIAPGKWTSPTTFGNQKDFLRNIEERGYYIYSSPVATQLPADRAARIAPLVQIAIKEAGAIHRSNVIVYINP